MKFEKTLFRQSHYNVFFLTIPYPYSNLFLFLFLHISLSYHTLFWVAVLEDFLAKVPKHNNNGSSNNNDIGLEFPTLRPQFFCNNPNKEKRMCVNVIWVGFVCMCVYLFIYETKYVKEGMIITTSKNFR